MINSRRSFIRNSAILLTGSTLYSCVSGNKENSREIVGVQLYSVRDDMKSDPAGTLRRLSGMGYRYVEHANYIDRKFYGYSPGEFKKILDDLGMKMPSGHTVMNLSHWDPVNKDFTDTWKYTVDDAALMGQQYVISPSLEEDARKEKSSLLNFLEVFNKSGELCRKAGMKFGYHNHDFEFNEQLEGETLYDIILGHTDPAIVIQQLDTGNLYNGGAKAMDIVRKYPGRFLSLHVKDEIPSAEGDEDYESTILGTGIVNLKEVIDEVRKGNPGVHYIIEQEAYQGKTPLDCMQEDLEIMRKWNYWQD